MLKLRVHIPDIHFASILFGPGFLSSVAHLLSVENVVQFWGDARVMFLR